MDYRHELKFFVSDAELALIRSRIAHIARRDENQRFEDGYLITSLYFDNVQDQCYQETLGGYDDRNKFRLRHYDHDYSLIKLEQKSKLHGMTAKKSVAITQQECEEMMHGQLPCLRSGDSETKRRILCNMKLAGMRPKCIVRYSREAFVYHTGNVRITFDRNISGSSDVSDFLSPELSVMPLLETNRHILEVKFDNFLPKYIKEQLEIERLLQTSFSKYGYARTALG